MRTLPLGLTLTAATALAAVLAPAAAAQTAGDQPCQTSCNGTSPTPTGWNVWTARGTAPPGGPGTGTPAAATSPGVVHTPCAVYPIAGDPQHMLRVCPLSGNGRYAPVQAIMTAVPVGSGPGGGPAITPLQLLAWAQNQLVLPVPAARTAQPRGSDGLVGLAEWFWVS